MDSENSLNLDFDISDTVEGVKDDNEVELEHHTTVPTEQTLKPIPDEKSTDEKRTDDVDILDNIDLDIPDEFLDGIVDMEKPNPEPENKPEPTSNDASKPNEPSSKHNENEVNADEVSVENEVQFEDEEEIPKVSAQPETKPVPDKYQVLEEMDKYLDQKDKEFGDEAVEEIKKHLDIIMEAH